MIDRAAAPLRALVLDRAHRSLLVRDGEVCRVPTLMAPRPARPLAAITQHVRSTLGLTLPTPSGLRADAHGQVRDFVFLIDAPSITPVSAAFEWAPLPRALSLVGASGDDAWLWDVYVDRMLGGWEPPTRDIDVSRFGDAPEMAAKLAHLVVCGDKRGSACWLRAAKLDGSALPTAGLVTIVTDGFGYPRCAIRTEEVRVLPLAEADEAIARLEGEGDLTIADWREGHVGYFEREAERLGLRFDPREEVLVERFCVLRVLGRAGA